MKLKPAFTIAELLICLVIIGVVACLVIPTQLGRIEDTKRKTAYKKAVYVLNNLFGIETVKNNFVRSADYESVGLMFNMLDEGLNVREYHPAPEDINNFVYDASKVVLKPDRLSIDPNDTDKSFSPWITTEDGISYVVGKGTDCKDKAHIVAALNAPNDAGYQAAIQASCVYIVVDVNGLVASPNTFEPQIKSGFIGPNEDLGLLTGDRFYVFVGTDGATSGPSLTSVEGRIVAKGIK